MMSGPTAEAPPNPPPLPPNRTGLLQRITAPFNLGTRAQGSHSTQSSSASPRDITSGILYKQVSSQTTTHRTGIPISALDLNRDKSHAVLAGQEILKTVKIQEGKVVEDFNLRSTINASSSYGPGPDPINQRREYLPAKDVRWSHGVRYDTIVATAALNGRIALYDVSRSGGSRVELEWIHQHTGQVNKLDFDQIEGYLLLSGSQDKTVKVWDIRDRKTVFKRHNFQVRHPVRDVKWSPSTVGEFAICTENGIIQKWDVRNPSQALLSINAHEKACYTIDWHPDGRHLVSGGFDKYVRVWDFKSENRRQKPAFQLRTPQAVMNLRWRPPCWSSESSQTGFWQCTQLVTSYTDDDPRLHVWDLRRPLLPFRELDQHSGRPTDLLWASKDLLWTVGNEGMFMQTDIRYAPQLHDEISPCSVQFAPDGGLMTFTEDMRTQRDLTLDDPSAKFLRIPQQKLSGAIDDALSRGVSDDEFDDDLSANASRKKLSKSTSARSAKSQGNTPPNSDGFPLVVSLDRSVLGRTDLFNNEQVGTLSHIDGVTADARVVEFLASNYVRPSNSGERQKDPGQILSRLEYAFIRNAEVCDYASLHRMAQSWRILCAIVIPELQDWANRNRQERLKLDQRPKRPPGSKPTDEPILHLPPDSASQPKELKISQRPQKVVSNLFRGVIGSEAIRSEAESTSNMTTPLAMPLPDSPDVKHDENNYLSTNDFIEPMPPLPPSVLNSHSTATAASNALIHDASETQLSREASPEQPRRDRSGTASSTKLMDQPYARKNGNTPNIQRLEKDTFELALSPRSLRSQEDRRAAIRDYRAQARPLFTLETPSRPSKHSRDAQPDSADSFPMFSASTDSSHKLQSLIESYDSVEMTGRPRESSEDWQHVHERESFDSTPPSGELGQKQAYQHPYADNASRKDSNDLAIDDAPGFSFGADGKLAAKPPLKQNPASSANIWAMKDLKPLTQQPEPPTTASSASDGMFHFEQVSDAPRIKLYASNPIHRMTSKQETLTLQRLKEQNLVADENELQAQEYLYSDFKPIDFTAYEPTLPFAWSALPLVCHTIAFDMNEGPACAQFAVHLVMHLHPFIFNQAFRQPLVTTGPSPETVAERLMRPDLSHRIIESLFLTHLQYLQKMALYGPMAELRKICVEFDYPAVYKLEPADQTIGAAPIRDPYQLQTSCTSCNSILISGDACSQCHQPKAVCPICLVRDDPSPLEKDIPGLGLHEPTMLWTYCQVCGHGAHLSCMQDWLQYSGAEGECPTMGCGCDCGPGKQRDRRLARQANETTNNEMIRGPRGGPAVTKKDPFRATPSPAVDKTRDVLRHADLKDRSTGGEDQIGKRSTNARGMKSASTSGDRSKTRDSWGNRRVRLVDPRE